MMQIRVGYEIVYDLPQPTPLLLTVHIHYSRASDIVLPDKSGIEVCRELRKLPETSLVPIVFLTSRDDVATELEGLSAGGDDYLVKPVNRERLLARIASQLRTSTLAE